MDQSDRTFSLLAALEAGLGALVALGVFIGYAASQTMITESSGTLSAAVIGLIGVAYYGSIHQLLKAKWLATSTLILTGICAINVIVTVAQTGGLDSPYYIFWLLIVIVAGAFGTIDTLIVVGATVLYFVVSFVLSSFDAQFLQAHSGQLVVTIVTGVLVEWAYWRSRRGGGAGSISPRGLPIEQLQAQVLMSQMGEGVIVVDAAGNIQLFNNSAVNLTGWDADSAKGIHYNLVMQLKTLDDQDITPDTDPFARAWREGKNLVIDNLVATTRAGRKSQISISVSPIFDNQHQVAGGIALFRDISEAKAVERQRDEFVSTASHEMRTPVAAIEGYISLAMNPNVATIDERARGFLEKGHDAVAHLGELFRDLLSVTKAEEGKLHGPMVAVNATDLVKRAVEDMQFTAAKKNLALAFKAAGAEQSSDGGHFILPLFWVKADPERLREVVMNLIDNAIKFTPEGGVTVTIGGDMKELRVAVTDSGIGIAQEDLQHLFQKFYRIDNSATRTIGGTGLGLYLCRTIIELFNGRIWATSEPGKGTTFTFSLPRLGDEEVAALQATTPAPAPAPNAITREVKTIATGNPDTTPMTVNPLAKNPNAAPVAPVAMPIPGQEQAATESTP